MAIAEMLTRNFKELLWKDFIVERRIAEKTDARTRIESNVILLEIMAYGENRDDIEKGIERVLKKGIKQLKELTKDDCGVLQYLAYLDVQKDYNSVKDFAGDDTESLYLTAGYVYGFRRSVGEYLKKHKVTLSDLRVFLDFTFSRAKRVAFEFGPAHDGKTKLRPTDVFQLKQVKILKYDF